MFKKLLYLYLITFVLVILFLLGYKVYKDSKPADDSFLEKYYKYTPETRYFRIGEKSKINNIEGEVYIKHQNQVEKKVVSTTDVEEGDVVIVKRNSAAELELKTGIIKIYDDAELHIQTIEEDSLFNEQKVALVLKTGKLLATVVKEENRNLDFSIKTSALVTGVRGTKFGITATENLTEVFCYEGLIKVLDAFKNEMFLRKGFKATAEINQSMSEAVQFNIGSKQEENTWFNNKWKAEVRLKNNKSKYRLLRERIDLDYNIDLTVPLSSYVGRLTPAGKLTLENYLKNVYKRLYGKGWELKYIQDRERLLNEYSDFQIEFFSRDPFAKSVIDDIHSKYEIDKSKKVDDYINEK